jgi:hypothetical protein
MNSLTGKKTFFGEKLEGQVEVGEIRNYGIGQNWSNNDSRSKNKIIATTGIAYRVCVCRGRSLST